MSSGKIEWNDLDSLLELHNTPLHGSSIFDLHSAAGDISAASFLLAPMAQAAMNGRGYGAARLWALLGTLAGVALLGSVLATGLPSHTSCASLPPQR